MKFNNYLLLFLFALGLGCSSSGSTDDPTPTPTPTPDYSTCRYTFNYKLNYPQLDQSKPATVTYLDANQVSKQVVLKDTSFSLSIDYKYGDSIYVGISPNLYFLNKKSNKVTVSKTLATTTSSCPSFSTKTGSGQSATFPNDTVPNPKTILSVFGVATRIK